MQTDDERFVLFTINIYIKSDDIRLYKVEDAKILETKIKRYLSLYLINTKMTTLINILPVISNVSHIEIGINKVNNSQSFINNEMFCKDIHDCLVSILPSKIDNFLLREFTGDDFIEIED